MDFQLLRGKKKASVLDLRLVISNFPDLKSDQAEAAARAASASTVATEDSPKHELRCLVPLSPQLLGPL